MVKNLWGLVLSVILFVSASTANAATVYWTDWMNKTSSSVSGVIDTGTETVDVTFSGSYSFAQTSGGTNYWIPSTPYISSTVDNEPPASDIIGLDTGGTATITFSEAVINPLVAVNSWNGNTVDFGVPITFLSEGLGYWGDGTPIINTDGTGFYGNGEVHGVIQLTGTYSSITFTHTSEYWHGLTVGTTSIVPVPAAIWLLGSGLFGLICLKGRATGDKIIRKGKE